MQIMGLRAKFEPMKFFSSKIQKVNFPNSLSVEIKFLMKKTDIFEQKFRFQVKKLIEPNKAT